MIQIGDLQTLSNRRIVVKFGGSSIRDSFNEALEFVLRLYENNEVMVVLSALEGVTSVHLSRGGLVWTLTCSCIGFLSTGGEPEFVIDKGFVGFSEVRVEV
ncbi:hypothetical protein [Thermococcus celer]|uniref:hypothetical protein n=1 Tax=Thermococcus celer TaxID=2264 RepID=UPI001F267D67|nr:hypothetical protein [Thermococcus celer]